MYDLAFIGTGNMGGAILRAVCRAQVVSRITVSNRTLAHSEEIAAECACRAARSNTECVQDADVIFLGVKPYAVCEVLREIVPALQPQQIVVSMAAGVTGGAMREILPHNPILRILPNTPCAVGEGLVLIAPSGEVSAEVQQTVADILAPCGHCAFTDEAHADAGMVIGGCTPAFTALFIEALADGGVAAGLGREEALAWAAQAVAGSAELLARSGKHPAQLKDEVCSPGGSTIEGVKALEARAFRAAVMEAVEAAFRKNQQFGKQRKTRQTD